MTVDDLGLILAGGAVAFLMIRFTCRAVCFLATRLIIPAVRLNLNILVGGVPGRAVRDIEDPAVLAPDPEEDDFM
jgi:hypothetical protein